MRKGGKCAGSREKHGEPGAGKNGSFDFFQNILIMLEVVADITADESGSGKFLAVWRDNDDGRIPGNSIFV